MTSLENLTKDKKEIVSSEQEVASTEIIPTDDEHEEASVNEKLVEAEERVIADGVKLLQTVDTQLAQASVSLNIGQEQADHVLETHGFRARIQSIKSKIAGLMSSSREKVQNIAIEEAQTITKVDVHDPRARTNTERIGRTLERAHSGEKIEEGKLWPKETLLADAGHIENQQIDLLYAPDGALHVTFKLTETQRTALGDKIPEPDLEDPDARNFIRKGVAAVRKMTSKTVPGFRKGKIKYKDSSETSFGFDCQERNIGGDTLRIADSHMRSTLGLVDVEIPAEKVASMSAEEVHEEITRILQNELGIENGTLEPEAEDERLYKLARYQWLHKTNDVPAGIEGRLTRKEVSPGYQTFVEEGKHQEYMDKGAFAVYHTIWGTKALLSILKAGGLLSTHERYRRGLIANGMSSSQDMKTGGADSVFTRIIASDSLNEENESIDSRTRLIFEPRILDRTDWYAYNHDSYGSTKPDEFNQRLSPEELLEQERSEHHGSNEQMFRSGISSQEIRAIATNDPGEALAIYEMLMRAGITEVHGKPIENMIVVISSKKDMVAISSGETFKTPVDLREQFENIRTEIEIDAFLKELEKKAA